MWMWWNKFYFAWKVDMTRSYWQQQQPGIFSWSSHTVRKMLTHYRHPPPPPPSFFWIFLYICMYACICICTKFLNYIGVVICCNKLSKVLLPPTSPKQKELSYFFIVLVGGKIVGYDLGWKQLQKMMAISLLLASTRIII